jgi:hypothetical protein
MPDVVTRWRDAFFRKFGANNFGGVTLGTWFRLLRDNRFSIDPIYWPRAASITLCAIPNSLAAVAENWRFGRAIRNTEVPPPLFVLGTWRSGTTHLHNLLAMDDRLAYPNQFQVLCPHTFLSFERLGTQLLSLFMPKRRPQDAVKMGAREPQEEDFAMCALSGQANLLAWAFPRNAAFYDRYMTMTDLSDAELARWKDNYRYFVEKVTYRYWRPLVLKSPANTGRVKTLLELFPDAKFVHIHRNPYDIFCSGVHTLRTAGPWWRLQRFDYDDEEAANSLIIRMNRTLYDAYFEQSPLIPQGRLHHIAFADLERDPVGELRKAYDALGLPDFTHTEPRLRAYLNLLGDYKRNAFGDLPAELCQRLQQEWGRYFEEFGYAT